MIQGKIVKFSNKNECKVYVIADNLYFNAWKLTMQEVMVELSIDNDKVPKFIYLKKSLC